MPFKTVALVAAALCVFALADLPYGYYTFLRIVVCGAAGYGALLAIGTKQSGWAIILGLLAVVFNPVVPVHLDRDTWAVVDLVTAATLSVAAFRIEPLNSKYHAV